jgi:hypothetical protein
MSVSNGQDKCAADWGMVEDSKLTVPSEITECLSWFTPKQKMAVSIDLSRQRMIIIRNLADVVVPLKERRQTILEDGETEDALRRVALTYHFFREATFVVPERRIRLKAVIRDHLGIEASSRLFCLAYAECIEAYNEVSARELISRHSADVMRAIARTDAGMLTAD